MIQEIHVQNEEVASFLQENSYVSRTISGIVPSLDVYTISLEELRTVINDKAKHFRSRLKDVATEDNKIDEVVHFFTDYVIHGSDSGDSEDDTEDEDDEESSEEVEADKKKTATLDESEENIRHGQDMHK